MTRLAVVLAAALACAPGGHHRHRVVHHHHAHSPTRLFPSLHFPAAPTGQTTAPPTQTDPPPAPSPPPPPSYPSRTGVDEGEYYVHLAHQTLAAGPVELNLTNFGMDDHDVTIDDADGHQVAQAYLVAGATGQLTPTLAAGTYRVYCSLYGGTHDQAGMHAVLTVVG